MDFPLAKPETLLDAHDVARLVAYLHQEDRERPVAVLTVSPGAAAPHVDATDIVRVGGGAIDVVTVPDQLTWVLSEAMGGRAYAPFLGACRVYPPGNAWQTDPFGVPLRMARNATEIAQLPTRFLDDVRTALAHPVPHSPAQPAARPTPALLAARRGPATAPSPTPRPSPALLAAHPHPPASPPGPVTETARIPNGHGPATPPQPTPPNGTGAARPVPHPPKPAQSSTTPAKPEAPARPVTRPPNGTAARPVPGPPRSARSSATPPKPGVEARPPAGQPIAGSPPSPVRQASPAGAKPVRVPPEILTAADAAALADQLHSARRRLPAVVVTRASGSPAAFANVDQLREDLAGLADVFEIATLEASWAFSDAVPDMCQVYGGASRVYPLGTEWEKDPYLSPLRFAYSRADRDPVTRRLIADAMGMATAGSLTVGDTTSTATTTVQVEGEVEGIVGERALVKLPGQFPGMVWPELIAPGIPAERLFAKRMRIVGTLDTASRRIDVRGLRQAPDEAVSGYRPDDTILVRVKSVSAKKCTVEPFPGLPCVIPAANVGGGDADLRELMTEGDVLAAWFGGRDETTGEWLLSPDDADEPERAVPAPSVLTGGPPWLVPNPPRQQEPVPDDEHDAHPAEQVTDEPTAELVDALRREKEQLIKSLTQRDAESKQLRAELKDAKVKLREAMRRKGHGSGHLVDDTALFDNDKDQFDFEIRLAWARTVQASEKASLPLRAWTYGPHFFDTLHAVQGIRRSKVVEVVVQVLTGLDAGLASRERHQLRTGLGGDDPPVVRNGGETCWRVSLQVKTPSARRLHYWVCADGSIELSSVRLHDDYRP